MFDRAALARVFVFNRVLDGDDVLGIPPIDQIHQRRNGRRLARAGWTADKKPTRKEGELTPRSPTEAQVRRVAEDAVEAHGCWRRPDRVRGAD